jgi:hypothetical protein
MRERTPTVHGRVPDAQLRILYHIWRRTRFTGSRRALGKELDISPGHVSTDLQNLIDGNFVVESKPREYRLTDAGKKQISFLTFPFYMGWILLFTSFVVAYLGLELYLGVVEKGVAAITLVAFGVLLAGSAIVILRQRRVIVELFFPGEEAMVRKLSDP